MKFTLLLTTMNELAGLEAIWNGIPFQLFDEAIVIDRNSTDGTAEFLRRMSMKPLQQDQPGRGNAIREAMEKVKTDAVVLMASDGNDDTRYIIPLVSKFQEGYDIVAGSRFMKGGHTDDSDDPLKIRRLANRAFTLLVNILWDARLTDATYGLRVFRKSTWDKMGIAAKNNETEFLMSIRASKMKLKVAEIPTVEGTRAGGKVKAKSIPTGISLVKSLLSEIWRS
jgi:glycosyltransferase involved in cell wall biosynthesis